MHARINLSICGCLLALGLAAFPASASPLAPQSVPVVNDGLAIQVRGGPACCRTTLRCVRKVAGSCKRWRYVTQSVCPGVRC
jgi:hypothetical protein